MRTKRLPQVPSTPLPEPAEFLGLVLNGTLRPTLAPTGDLSEAIAARRLSFGLDAMEITGDAGSAGFGAIVSLKDYPARTAPGLLDGVLRLPMELVLTETFAFVDRQAALDRMGLAMRRLRAADDDARVQLQRGPDLGAERRGAQDDDQQLAAGRRAALRARGPAPGAGACASDRCTCATPARPDRRCWST